MKLSLLLFSIFLLLACGGKKEAEPETAAEVQGNTVTLTAAQKKNAAIAIGYAEMEEMVGLIRLSGQTEAPPQNLVSVSVPMGGYLKSSHLMPGMPVKKGEVIATVEDQQYIQLQQEYLTTKARMAFAEKEYQRQRSLNESQSSSDKVYQQAESDYRLLQALLASLRKKLELAGIGAGNVHSGNIRTGVQVYSPINGYVAKVNVNNGRYVAPTETLFELINPADVHVVLQAYEKDLVQLRNGQRFRAWTNSEPERKHGGTLILMSKNMSAGRSAEIHGHFDRYDPQLIPGTFLNAEIETTRRNAVLLPEAAVVHFEGRNYIFTETGNNKYEMVEVATGAAENGKIEIITPSLAGKKTPVVISGAYTLLMALKNTAD